MAKNDFGPWKVEVVPGLVAGEVSVVSDEHRDKTMVHLSAMKQGINLEPEKVLEISKTLAKAAKEAMKYEKQRAAA